MSVATVWDVPVKSPDQNTDFAPPPAGSQPARICALIDVGFHQDQNKEGKAYEARKIVVGYELSKKKADGKPFVMIECLTFSMTTSSKLYERVSNVTGQKPAEGTTFNPTVLLGQHVMLTVVHDTKQKNGKDRTYGSIGGVTGYPEEFPKFSSTIEPLLWSVVQGTPPPDLEFLGKIYSFHHVKMMSVRDLIADSAEAKRGVVVGLAASAPATTPASQPAGNPLADTVMADIGGSEVPY